MAKGSHAVFGPHPRVCDACHKPVRMNGLTPLWFSTDAQGVHRSHHFDCRLAVLREGRAA